MTPPMGVSINGYFFDRFVDGVLDELEANAVAMECGGKRAVITYGGVVVAAVNTDDLTLV